MQHKLASEGSLLLFLSAAQQLMSANDGKKSFADALEVLREAMRQHPDAAAPAVSMGNVRVDQFVSMKRFVCV